MAVRRELILIIVGCVLIAAAGALVLIGLDLSGGQYGDAGTLDMALWVAGALGVAGLGLFIAALVARLKWAATQ